LSTKVDKDALLCGRVLAPRTFSRNRFFDLFEEPEAKRIRRRASRVRGIIRQLSGNRGDKAEITGERILGDGRVLIRYTVGDVALRRTSALTRLEAAALHFALHRAGVGEVTNEDRTLIESAFARLGQGLELAAEK
jgi:hypothetical protein